MSKISSGYLLTSHKKMGPKRAKENANPEFDKEAFQELLNCPEKKKIVLQLLSDNKHIIAKHREIEINSPVEKLKQKKNRLESPTALYRRRALQQMDSPSISNKTNSSKLDSPSSSTSTETVPLNEVLKGVIAYVEVKNSYDEDRSEGAKIVLKSMGAVVRKKFTRDVTHVVFKNGCYQTYQKAKLLKVHLVSILWIEFCRKTLQRQKEKLYPALKGAFENESIVCSQLQKEYEEIVRNEYKKSIIEGTPLPTTASLISRRRTLMTNSSSSDSFKTAEESNSILNEIESNSVNNKSHQTCVPETPQKITSAFTRRKTMFSVDSTLNSSITNLAKENSVMSKQDSLTSNESIIFGKKTARKFVDKTDSSTSMSSLRLSTAKSATSMSSLKLSSKSKKSSFSNISSEMPELKLSSENISDDSEILSPVKQPITKNLLVQIEKLPNVDGERKKMGRKLYNPEDYIPSWQWVDDDKEREERRLSSKRKKANVTGFNPLAGIAFNPSRDEEESQDDLEIEINKNSPPKKPKTPKKPALNESADEQRDLLKEVLKTQKSKTTETPTRRKSLRIQAQTPVNRRSTLEFVPTLSKKKSKKKVNKLKLPTIVCTKLHRADVQLFAQIVKKLGRFVVEDEVSERTTHLVAGEPKRTINMLRAISRGCWVLKFDWVLQSLENGKWLPEENFELTDFSSAVQKSRLERQAFGSNYTLDVFETTPPIYVAPSTIPRCSDLKELITTCKGKVVSAARMAKIVVGQYVQQDETKCVNESWVLDCITFYRRMSFKEKYLLKAKKQSVAV